MYFVQLVVRSFRIDHSIIVAIVVRPAVVMLYYLLVNSVRRCRRRRPTDLPNPVRLNFVYCYSLTAAADLVAVDSPTKQLLLTVVGIATMIQQLMFPKNTQIHFLHTYPIWCKLCMSVCDWARWFVIKMKRKNK